MVTDVIINMVKSNNITGIKEYIKLGGDIDIIDERKWTPLLYAVHLGHEEICKLLIEEGCNINREIFYNVSYLSYVTVMNNRTNNILKLLVNNNADLKYLRNANHSDYKYKDKFEELGETKFKIWVNML